MHDLLILRSSLRQLLPIGVACVLINVIGCGARTGTDIPLAPPITISITISITPTSATVQVGETLQFTAGVQNSTNTSVTWQVNGVTGGDAAHGTISTTGLYIAPSSVPNPSTVTVTAISQADNTKSVSATVAIAPLPPSITISILPTSATLQVGQTLQFTATVQNSSNTSVTWQVNGVTGAVPLAKSRTPYDCSLIFLSRN